MSEWICLSLPPTINYFAASEMTRTELKLKLEMLRTIVGDRKVRNGVRDLLDSLVGEYKYGGMPNPWASCTATVRDSIPKSVEAQKLIDSGLSNKELQTLLRTEHEVEIQQLTVMLREGLIEAVIDEYSVAFVTREEDKRLKQQGVKGAARYDAASIAMVGNCTVQTTAPQPAAVEHERAAAE